MSGWSALYIFMLAAFTGYVVISAVPVILHTPLMSGANFVHGIVLVGAMIALGFSQSTLEIVIATAAVVLAAMNVHGGYVVTVRMLAMFRSSRDRAPAKGADAEAPDQAGSTGDEITAAADAPGAAGGETAASRPV